MNNFYSAKKKLNEDDQFKYYIMLKAIFQKNEENIILFKEVESFIRYKPPTALDSSKGVSRVNLKRKLTEND